MTRLRQGMRLGGRYQLTRRLAVGGMAEVWEGVDHLLHRPVAVKVLSAALAADDVYRQRFRQEARTAGGLSHPGIAGVYDFGEVVPTPPPGTPAPDPAPTETVSYLVMELIRGRSLATILAEEGALGTDGTLEVITQAARALQVAHDSGVVHRDIKPSNLMVTPQGQVKITDFGIAHTRRDAPLTGTGQVVGTPEYIAPELCQGQSPGPRSDIYALGVVAYECLAGRRPFDGHDQLAVVSAHVHQVPPGLPETIAAEVRQAVLVALGKRPEQRYASAEQFADELDRIRGERAGREAVGALPTRVIGSASAAGPAGPAVGLLPPRSVGSGPEPRTYEWPSGAAGAAGAVGAAGADNGDYRDYWDDERPDRPARRVGGRRMLLLSTVVALLGITVLIGPAGASLRSRLERLASGTTGHAAAAGTPTAAAMPSGAGTAPATTSTTAPTPTGSASPAPSSSPAVITLSAGPATANATDQSQPSAVTVPDESHRSADAAQRDLTAAGFTVGATISKDSPSVPQGQVIRTDPAAGSSATAGSRVDLQVSTGMVTVPDLTGSTLTQALQVLQDQLLLTVTVDQLPSDQAQGTVLGQDVRDTRVPQGSQVTLTVATSPWSGSQPSQTWSPGPFPHW